MYRRILGRLATGAALASAALFVVAPGVAAADTGRYDTYPKGDIYVFPRYVQPGHDIKIVEFCKEPQRYPTIWSDITGTLPLKRAHLFEPNGGDAPAAKPAPSQAPSQAPGDDERSNPGGDERSAPGGDDMRSDRGGKDLPRSVPGARLGDDDDRGAKDAVKAPPRKPAKAPAAAEESNSTVENGLFTYWTEAEVPWYTKPSRHPYLIKGVCGYAKVWVKGVMREPAPISEPVTKEAVYKQAPQKAAVEEPAQLSDPMAEMAEPGALVVPKDAVEEELQPDLGSAPRGGVSAGDGGVGAAHADLAASGVGVLGLAGFGRLALRRRRRNHGHA
jgi:hypothetical protein